MMRVNQINSQESAITIGCGFFYYLFKDYRELVCFEITQCDWLMFATDVFERLSINRAWGEHKMCWTLHFKKFWGWNRHRSLSQSCRISSRINELPWLPIYHYRFSHILSAEHDVCSAPRSMDWKCILRQVATSRIKSRWNVTVAQSSVNSRHPLQSPAKSSRCCDWTGSIVL